MTTPTTGTLAMPGASLYYEVRGSGPPLLLIPTGNGDAAPYGPMADTLADRFTVISYDRRGFSRSPLRGPVDDARVEADVLDASGLIEHLAGEPAHAFGSSSGAIIALALLERRPDQVRTLVSHEPPLASVLPDAAYWLRFYDELYDYYLDNGAEEAMKYFRKRMGMTSPTKPPKGTELPPDELAEMLSRIRRNHVFWFEHEIRTYPAYLPDIAALKAVSERLVLAGGRASRGDFPYRPNMVLAEQIGVDIVDLPGGHVGYVTDPYEFADELAGVLVGR